MHITKLLHSKLLKKIAVIVIGLLCTSEIYALTYRWAGGTTGDGDWSTLSNWEQYSDNNNWSAATQLPGTTDYIIVNTGTTPATKINITITLNDDTSIGGLITFGLGDFTVTSTGKTFSVTTAFIGSSAHSYRANEAPAPLTGLPDTNYIIENFQGNINIAGSTIATITNLDTSSWTKDNTQNTVVLKDTSIMSVTGIWNSGDNNQGGTYGTDRTNIIKDETASIAVTGKLFGNDDCKGDLSESLDDGGAAVVETPPDEGDNTYVWLGTSTDWNTASNWYPSTVPNSTHAVVMIPKSNHNPIIGSEIEVKSLSINKSAAVTLNNNLTINGNFTLNNSTDFVSSSTGTLKSTGKVNIKADYNSNTLNFECIDLDVDGNFQCKTLTASTSTTINSGKTLKLGTTSNLGSITNNGTIDLNSQTYTLTSYSGTGEIKINGGTLTNSTEAAVTISTLTPGTTESTLTGGSDGFVISSISGTNGNLKTSGDISLNGTLQSLNLASGTLTLSGDTTIPGLSCISGTSVNVSSYTLNVGSGYFVFTNIIDSSATGKIKSNGEITISENYSTTTLAIECYNLNLSRNLSCDDLTVYNETTINNGTKLTLGTNFDLGKVIKNNGIIDVGAKELTLPSYSGTGEIEINGGTLTNSTSNTVTIGTLSVGSAQSTLDGNRKFTITNALTGGNLLIKTDTELKGTVDTLSVYDGKTITLSAATSAGIINNYYGTINIVSNTLTNTTSYSGNGKLTINGGTFTNSGSAAAVLEIDITTSATLNGGNGLFAGRETYHSSPAITTSGSVTLFGGTIGALNVSSGSTLFNSDVTTSTINATGNLTTNGTLSASAVTINGSLTAKDNVTADSITIGASGNLTGANGKTISVGGNWTNGNTSGGYTHDSGTVAFTADAVISGNSTFNNLKCTTPGTTLTFDAGSKQTASALTITGTKASPITLKSPSGTWEIDVPVANANVSYAYVMNSSSANDSITAQNSISRGNNTNWKFLGTYIWSSTATSTVWTDPSNWTILQFDDSYAAAYTYPHYAEDVVTINSKTKVPALSADATLNSITITSSGEIDLQNYKLTATTTKNEGVVNITLGGATHSLGSLTENGTVIYSGTGNTLTWGNTYKNIEFTTGASTTTSTGITVSGTTKIDSGTGNAIALTGANTFTGNITISSGGDITLASSSNMTVVDSADADSIDFKGPVTAQNITTSGNLTFENTLSLSGNTTLTSTSGTISFGGNISGVTSTLTLAGNSETTNAITITASEITNNASKTLTVPASKALNITGKLTNNGTISASSDISVTGAMDNNTGASVSSTANLSVSGDLSDTGTWSAVIIFNGSAAQKFTNTAATSYSTITNNNTHTNGISVVNALTTSILNNNGTLSSASTIQITNKLNNKSSLTPGGDLTAEDIDNQGTITVGANTLTTKAFSASNTNSVSVDAGTITITGNTSAVTIPNVSITTSANINGDTTYGVILTSATYNSSPAITTTGKVSLNGGTIGAVTVSSDSTTFTSDVTASSISIGASGNLSGTNGKTISVGGNWTNGNTNGGYTHNSGTVAFTADAVISGNSTFNNLECTAPGTILTFEAGATQTISGTLTLKGSSGNLVKLISSNPGTQWNINAVNHDIEFVDVADSNNVNTNKRLSASGPSNDSGNNVRWNFIGTEYTWTGSSGNTPNTNWFDKTNWDKNSIPGIGAYVTIPEVTSPNVYPVLEKDLKNDESDYASIGFTGKITVNADAELNLNDKSVSVDIITNNGRIILEGNQIIKADSSNATKIENSATSVVEYYGNCSTNPMKGNKADSPNYGNIEFTTGAYGTITDSISIAGTTLIANGASNSLTLSGAANTFNGKITLTNATDQAGVISITSNSNVTVENDAKAASLSLTTTEKNIIFENNLSVTGNVNLTGSVILQSNLTTTGNTTITGSLSTTGGASGSPAVIDISGADGLKITGNYTNTGFITNNAAKTTVTGSLTNSGTATFNNKITVGKNFTDTGTWINPSDPIGSIILNGTDNQIFTANPATIYNSITVNSQKNLNFAETTNITSLDITEVADVTFSKPAIINTANLTKTANNTFEAAASIATLSIGTASTTKFNGTTSIGTLTDTATAGNFTFSGSGSITSDTVLLTTGTVTFGSSQNSTFAFTSADNTTNYSVSHTTGSTELYGTLSAADISLAKTNCNTDLIINCDNFTLSGNLSNSADVAYAKLYGTLTLSGSITVSPDFILDGSLSGNTNSIFQKNLYLYTNSATPADISITDAIIAEDLIIESPRNINTNGTLSAANVVLYKGSINAASNSLLKAEKDIVLLGKDYSIADTITNNPVEFIYQQTRLSPWNYNRSDFTQPATMPDGTELSKAVDEGGQTPPLPDSPAFTGTYKAAAGACIYAGKNFYANGVTLSGSDEWFVLIPDVTNGNYGFAETYYSQIDHSTVYCHNNTVTLEDDVKDGSKARMPAFRCGDNENNTWWIFEDFAITEAYTVRDNTIYVKFNHPILNINNELTLSLNRFKNSDGENSYIGFYSDPDCTKPIQTGNILSGDVYIKAANSWNTDATGTSAGSQNATDRKGDHKDSIPYLEIAEKLTESEIKIADIWGKKATKYSGDNKFTEVQDKTGPVLYSVRTGQELHTIPDGTAESQHSYDAHNFIEFRYSEPTDFGSQDSEICTIWIPAYTETNEVNITENIRVSDSLGAVTGDITKTASVNLAGLGTLENGKLYTGSKGKADKYVNALYRKDAYSLCLSIAGYTEGTVADPSGNVYKNWLGYIENAVLPTGTVTMNFVKNDSKLNPVVSDINGNFQEYYDDTTQNVIPEINSMTSGVYGLWDISEPIFAPLRMSTTKTKDGQKTNNWTSEILEGKYQSEAIGNTSGVGSTLDRIEFHLFDNTPTFATTEPEWVSEIGWINPNAEAKKANLYKEFSYSADIFGGARTFDDENRTSGGIRYSSVYKEAGAFKYINSMYDDPTLDFASDLATYAGATGLIFIGTSSPRRSALDLDGLYFGLPLPDSSYDIKTTFTVSYDSTNSFITDLAGNRLRSKTFQTIDRTPPSFDISLSPINQNELYVTFVKQLVTDSSELIYIDNDGNVKDVSVTGSFENLLSSCFKLITIDENGNPSDSTGLQIDSSRPAQIMDRSSERFTCIKLYLNQNVTLKDVETLYLAVTHHPDYNEYSQDPFTSHKDSRVTFIQDPNKNYMEMYTAHALSDFVIGGINPLYAYDQDMSAEDSQIMNGLYQEGSWAVHDWTAEQKNYGTLPANHSLAIVADLDDGTAEKENLPVKARIYLSNNPDAASVSKQYNADFKDDLRIWLPDATEKVFTALAEKNNTNYSYVDSQLLDSKDISKGLLFDIPKEITQNWASQDQITFLFGLMDQNNNPINIIHSPELNMDSKVVSYLTTSTEYPLYALRLANPADITSIDLWSFKLKSITEQRGGVSILNNVINNSVGEKTVVKVNLPEEGRLNVIVMTLDGNVVTYLQRGQTSAGEHYYAWDGKNKNGAPVARGLYFVRVIADGIDETRKVMVVK